MSGKNDDRLSIARSVWRDAQEREKVYWAKRFSDPIGIMYEMGEDLDLAWRLKECIATEPASFLACRRPRAAHQSRAESRYVIGQSETLPFRDETFDVVVCNNVLDHVEQVEQSVAELCRVVRTGESLGLGLDTNSRLGYWLRKVDRMMRPALNTYRLHPTDVIIGHIENRLRELYFRILSSNAASRLVLDCES